MKRDVNQEKRRGRERRHERVRKHVHGTAARPRLAVFRSLNHIYAQIIDDDAGKTLAQASSLKIELPAAPAAPAPAPEAASEQAEKPEKGEKGGKGKGKDAKGKKPEKPLSMKMRRSVAVGKAIAAVAIERGITTVAFDRGGYIYHGRVAALAKAARDGGLKF